MKKDKSQLTALSRLFSSTVFRDLAKTGRSSLFCRLATQANIKAHCGVQSTVADAFDSAFRTLKIAGQRDEYIYRAAISHKILMGTHSLRTASMLNEFRTGSCKADIVILNGTATVYEIKSERDSLVRLANQIENYRKVFSTINVITSENHIDGVLTTVPDDVGVLCLSKRYQITTERKAVTISDHICSVAIFESLRSTEANAILKEMNVTVPKVPNTQLRTELRKIFAELDPSFVHASMVRILKKSRNLAPIGDLVDQLPESLQAAALSIPVRRADHGRLIEAMGTPLSEAMAWS